MITSFGSIFEGDNNGQVRAYSRLGQLLWTAAPYGREYRHYAGSWHAMIGAVIQHRTSVTGAPQARPVGPEWIVGLEWYRGYAPDGQLLDQRLSYRPRGYLVPSITAYF